MTSATADNTFVSAPTGSAMTQTWGLLVDAYRDLRAKRLFWITLLLSVLVVVAFGLVGINERGITILHWEIPGAWNTHFIPKDSFYKFMFTTLAIPTWLGFFAAILALISVAGTFPDLLTGGAIDLYLSKPIGRVRLFLTKYLFALLFVALQVFVFSFASFIVIGIRGGAWEPKIFLAVPLVTIFFSYLFCICALVGTMTRSTLAAILITALAWGALFCLNAADEILLTTSLSARQQADSVRGRIAATDQLIARNAELPPERQSNLSQFEFQRDRQREQLASAEENAVKLEGWHRLVVGVKTPLPKTTETVALMSRWLVDPDPITRAREESQTRRDARITDRRGTTTAPATNPADEPRFRRDFAQLESDKEQAYRSRSAAWVIGTSMGFQIVIVAAAVWVFSRRDY